MDTLEPVKSSEKGMNCSQCMGMCHEREKILQLTNFEEFSFFYHRETEGLTNESIENVFFFLRHEDSRKIRKFALLLGFESFGLTLVRIHHFID